MKKNMLFMGVFVFLLVGFVSAVGGSNGVQEKSGVMEQNQVQAQVRVNLSGVENAQLRVRHEDTQRHLEQVWSRIQLRDRNRFGNLSGLSVEEVVVVADDGMSDLAFEVKGVKKAKLFGLFNVNKIHTYSVNQAGQVDFEKKGFDFLFKMEE